MAKYTGKPCHCRIGYRKAILVALKTIKNVKNAIGTKNNIKMNAFVAPKIF